MAERVGFEPTIEFPLYTRSSCVATIEERYVSQCFYPLLLIVSHYSPTPFKKGEKNENKKTQEWELAS